MRNDSDMAQAFKESLKVKVPTKQEKLAKAFVLLNEAAELFEDVKNDKMAELVSNTIEKLASEKA